MSDGDALRAAVAAAPEDDTARLVYADWLDEQGDAALAAFIRDSVQLVRTPVEDANYPALLARVRRAGMFTHPRRPWVDHVPGATVMFRRGFIAGVNIDSARYIRHAPEAWEWLPLEQLALARPNKPAKTLLKRLVDRRDLARVPTLHLRGQWRVAELEPLLCGCPHLAKLRALRLGHYDWQADEGNDVWRTLGELAPRLALPSLDSLHLYENFAEDMWRAFVEGLSAPLRRLWLETYTESEYWAEAHGYEWLRTTRHWPTLEEAQIWHGVNYTSTGSWETPAFVRDMPGVFSSGRLRSLAINPQNFRSLLAVPAWGALRALCVSYDWDGTADVTPLAYAPQAKSIERLILRTGSSDDAAHQEFIRGTTLANVRELALTPHSPILLNGPYRERLVRLAVKNESGIDWVAVVAGTALPELRSLELLWGYGGHQPLAPLYDTANLPNLCTLLLTDRDAVTMRELKALASNPNLPHLSLVGVGSFGVKTWYVLVGGKSKRVAKGIVPVDSDWWEVDLLAKWL